MKAPLSEGSPAGAYLFFHAFDRPGLPEKSKDSILRKTVCGGRLPCQEKTTSSRRISVALLFLTGSILLSDRADGSSPREYIVDPVTGTGGSSVCYEARTIQNGDVKTGKLKEFYPVDSLSGSQAWYYSLERLPNGQLVPEAGTIRKFDEMCAEFIEAYRLLWKVIGDDPKNEVLKGYIQQGEILYGW